MKELTGNYDMLCATFYLFLALAIGFLVPALKILIYFDLAKERHYTRWGAILRLADNMEGQTASLFGYVLREIIFFSVIGALVYVVIKDPPVIEWFVRVTDNMYNSFTAR